LRGEGWGEGDYMSCAFCIVIDEIETPGAGGIDGVL